MKIAESEPSVEFEKGASTMFYGGSILDTNPDPITDSILTEPVAELMKTKDKQKNLKSFKNMVPKNLIAKLSPKS